MSEPRKQKARLARRAKPHPAVLPVPDLRKFIREAEARAAEAHVLKTVAEVLNRAVGLQEALDRSLEAVMGLIDSEAGWILLLDELGGTRLAAARNLPPVLEADDRAAMRWHGCTCQVQLVAGKLTAAVNLLECERLKLARGDTRGLRYHASVPLRVDGRALAVLNLATPADRLFTEDELRLLTAVGDQIGVAIERARLHEQVKAHHIEEQAALLRLSQALLGGTEAQAMMDLAVRVAAEALKVEFVAVALLDAEGASVSARASLGWPPEMLPRLQRVPPEAASALAYAIRSRAPVVIPDESRETRFKIPPWIAEMGIVSSLLAPMLAGGRAIGGLVVNSRSPRPWSDDEVRLLSLIANDTAQALERARLFAETQRRVGEQAALLSLSRSLIGLLDADAILDHAAGTTHEIFGADLVSLMFADAHGENLILRAGRGWERDLYGIYAVDQATSREGYAFRNGEALWLEDVQTSTRFPCPQGLCERGIHSSLTAPLNAEHGTLGTLCVHFRERRRFDDHDVQLISFIANTTAQALERARLFEVEREQRELAEALRDALGAGAALSATLDFDTVLDRLLEQIARVVPYDTANVMLLDAPTGRICVARQRGYEQFGERVVGDIAALSFDIAATANLRRMAETRQPLVIPDTAAYPDWVKVEVSAHVRAWAGAPIVVEGQVIAFFSLDKIEPNFYRPEHGKRLAAFAGQAALALQNARLFAETAEALSREQRLNEVARAISGALDLAAVLQNVVRLACELVGGAAGAMALVAPDGETITYPYLFNLPERLKLQPTPRSRGVAWRIVETGELVLLRDYGSHPDALPDWVEAGVRGFIGVPVAAGEARLGALGLFAFNPEKGFAERDLALAESVGRQAGVAIQNARLFKAKQWRVEALTALHQIGFDLSAQLDLPLLLRAIVERAARLLEGTTGGLYLLQPDGQTLELVVSHNLPRDFTGVRLTLGEGLAGKVAQSAEPMAIENYREWPERAAVYEGVPLQAVVGVPIKWQGQVIGVINVTGERPNRFGPAEVEMLNLFADQAAVAIQNARLFEETARRAAHQTALNAIITAATRVGADLGALLGAALEHTLRALGLEMGAIWLIPSPDGPHRFAVRGLSQEIGATTARIAAAERLDISGLSAVTDWQSETGNPDRRPLANAMTSFGIRASITVPLLSEEKRIGGLSVAAAHPRQWADEEIALLEAVGHQLGAAAERARLFEETHRRAGELAALAHVSSALRQAQTREAMLPLLVETTMEMFHADAGTLLFLDGESLVFAAARGPGEALLGQHHPPGDDPLWQVVRTDQAMFVTDVDEQDEFSRWEVCRVLMAGLRACACVPLKTAEATIGLLHLASRSKRVATEGEVRLLASISEMAGNALHRATLHEQTTHRLQRLAILRAIDAAISASLDLRVTLNVFLDQVTTQLRLDAADVLLLNPLTQTLEYAVGRGFRGSAITRTRVRLGAGHASRAALEQRVVHVSNLPQTKSAGLRTQQLTGEEAFVTYYAVPLIAKGEVKGVLEIFHRTPLNPDPEWLDFLEALAVQAAIAIDNAALYDNLQRSNTELALAYDATIEGWSRALDLRDKETEGHTQRVTELTLRLARVMGIPDADLAHIRRGALLHDIGKMGVPDSILLEPGPLTDEEWEIMRRHPQYAYDMLSPIAFLRPALHIPYCHHEKWNGTGYPRGLKGEQIPLVARVFAVADVWDALRSDRPYRTAWPEEKVREHIRSQAGAHFDPQVVETFLELVV